MSAEQDERAGFGARLMELAGLVERLTGPDREVDLAIHLALYPDGEIAKVVQHPRGLEGLEGYAWDIWQGSVIIEKRTADGRCPFNAGYPLPAVTASLDAAMTLVSDGLAWTLGKNVHHGYWQASVNYLNEDGAPDSVGCSNATKAPALALTAACLRALSKATTDSRDVADGGGER